MAGATVVDASPIVAPEPWMDEAVCASVINDEIWYPPKGGTSRPAKAICKGCPVITECLTYALTHREHHGVWGGASERERRRMRVSYPCARCSLSFLDRRGLTLHERTHLAVA